MAETLSAADLGWSAGWLDRLALPEDDRNIIVTIHYYEPFPFTHQGAPWSPSTARLSGVRWGSEAERNRLEDDFRRVQKWSLEHRRPILLGEFGAYDKGPMGGADPPSPHSRRLKVPPAKPPGEQLSFSRDSAFLRG